MTTATTTAKPKRKKPTRRPLNWTEGGLEPGVHENVADEDYFALPYLNQSTISKSFDDYGRFTSLVHGRARLEEYENESRDVTALELGRAFHEALLEPERFDERAVDVEKSHAASDNGRAFKVAADFEWARKTYGNKPILPPGWREQINHMRNAILSHEWATKLVTSMRETAQAELVLVWDERVGDDLIRCKAKIDRALPGKGLVDVKTTRDLVSPEALRRTILRFGWHRQSVWYSRGALACGLFETAPAFFYIAVEKQAPHGVCVVTISDDLDDPSHPGVSAVDTAWADCVRFLGEYARALKTGEWTGYAQTVQSLDLPIYAFDRAEKAPYGLCEFPES